MSPMATAVTRSTNTVSASVAAITMRYRLGIRGARLMKRHSMMSSPTFVRMPASAAVGMLARCWPSPSATPSRSAEQITPATGERPPARMFTTEPDVFPAPGSPPTSPAARFPSPCPTSSLSGLWRVRVSESATSAVSSVSMEPSSARMIAGSTARTKRPAERSGAYSVGRPDGTSPITGAPVSQNIPSPTPTTSAASVDGT